MFSIFFHFPVISGADEIRFRRHLEAANTEEEYNGQNDTHRLNSRERVLTHRYLQEGGKVHFQKAHMVKSNMRILELSVF